MPQDAFNTLLTDVKAPAGPDTVKRADYGSSRVIKGTTGMALEGAGTLLAGGAELLTAIGGKELEKGVDRAIDTSFEAAFPIEPGGDIDNSLNRLEKIKMASGQGKDTSDRFQLTLLKEVKTMKANNPERIASIDKALRDRGLVDPRIYIMAEQAKRETEQQQVEDARRNTIITAGVTGGWATYTVPGDPTSPVDVNATIKTANGLAVQSAKINADFRALGFTPDANGNVANKPAGVRLDYLKRAEGMKNAVYNNIVNTLSPIGAQLTALINSGVDDAAKTKKLQEFAQKFTATAKQIELQAITQSAGLTAEESKDYVESVKSMLVPFVQMALPIANTGDLNAAKTAAMTLDIMKDQANAFAWKTAPALKRLTETVPKEVSALYFGQLAQRPEMQTLFKSTSGSMANEFSALFGMTPQGSPSSYSFPELKTDENKHSEETRKDRIVFSAKTIQESINKNVIVGEDKKTAEWWIRTQIPVYKAFTGVSDQTMSVKDEAQLANQMMSDNYFANLMSASKHYPDGGMQIGGYSFDVVQKNMLNNIRELQDSEGVDVIWDSSNKRLIANPPPTIDGVEEPISPLVSRRMDAINKAVPYLLSTKQFKENYKNLSETEFVNQVVNDMTTNFGNRPVSEKGGIDFNSMTPAQQEKWKQEQIASAERGPKGLAKAISDFFGKGFTEPKQAAVKEPAKEQVDFQIGPIDLKEDKLNDIVKAFENRQLAGKDDNGMWHPHPAIEGGRPNIGYGHKLTKAELAGEYVLIDGQQVPYKDGLSDANVDSLLQQDLKIAETFVNKEFGWLSPKQKEAVSSLIYNVGVSEFKSSKAYKHLKDGAKLDFIKEAFDKPKGYVYINNKFSPGLAKRRTLEKEMFLTGE